MNSEEEPVRVWDYLPEYAVERADILDAVQTVFNSGRLILGESVAAFEREFAAWCGTAHGVGVGNGTDALTLALQALGIVAGDEVVTVPNTAVPTVSAIVEAGGVPRFVDINPATYLMDATAIEAVLTPRTRFLLPVHLYGQCVDMDRIGALARKHDLKVVEDCAQAHGAEWGGRRAGSMSDAAGFSFYPTKLLGGYGDGGMVLTGDPSTDARLRRLRFYGMSGTYYSEEHGRNSRLDEIHAEILRRKLRRLDGYLARRRQIAATYDAELRGLGLGLPVANPGGIHAYYLYVVRHPRRDWLLEQLTARGISLNVSYPWPIHTMRGYARLGYREGDFPEAEGAAREIFSLPMYPSLKEEQQGRVIDALKAILCP